MFRTSVLAAAVACLTAPAFAQAAPVEIELEGVIESFDNATSIMSVMGMQVQVQPSTELHTPVTSRGDTNLTQPRFIKGLDLPGRKRGGFLGGTAIVVGVWDAGLQKVMADDIIMEPGENVALGVVTASQCSNAACDGVNDYIRGNTKVGGGPGPALRAIRDIRMQAGDVGDESFFALDLTGQSLVGTAYAAEGYYGQTAVEVPDGSGGTAMEKAFHYFLFDLIGYRPDLFQAKNIREVNAFRGQCRDNKDFEVRGHVHTRISSTGTVSDTIQPTTGVVEVVYTVGGVTTRLNAAALAVDVGSPIGLYRVRGNIGTLCPTTVNIRWVQTAGAATAFATLSDYPMDIRAD